jgi:preprotein translocase subunit SecB
MSDENASTGQNAPAQQFAIQRIYTKDVSFEVPFGPSLFGQAWKPAVHQEIATRAALVENEVHEVVLMITITGKIDEKPAFVVEVQQAGLFVFKGFEDGQIHHLVGAHCPNILFPYAREAIDNLMVRGGLPPLMLPPINFDAVYQQALAQQAAQEAPELKH